MVRKITITAACLLFGVVGTLDGQNLGLGVKGGVNVATVHSDASGFADAGDRAGFVGGLFFDIGVTALGAVQLEGLYSQKGFVARSGEVLGDVRLNYVDIPLLLKGSYNERGSGFRPSAYVGGVLSFETDCKLNGAVDGETVDADCDDESVGLNTRKTDFGLLAGLSTDVRLTESGFYLVLDARYNWGLLDILDDPQVTDAVQNRYWTFMAGFGVPLRN